MNIQIYQDLCKACGQCLVVCPGDLIRSQEDKKATILNPNWCWGCCSCVKACPYGAIKMVGNHGTTLEAQETTEGLSWHFKKEGEDKKVLITHKKEANTY